MALSTGCVQIRDEDRPALVSWTRSTSVRVGLATRAKIVLAAARGEGTSCIARRLRVSRPTVIQWRDRYSVPGLDGLRDAPVLELQPGNTIAANAVYRLEEPRRALADQADPDASQPTRARRAAVAVRGVFAAELDLLVEACRGIPPSQVSHVANPWLADLVTNVQLTVLDLQMQNPVIDRSINHYWDHRWDEIRTLEDLEEVLDRRPADKAGNTSVAQYLWGTNHWTRVSWLRGLVSFLIDEGLTTMETLTEWAHRADFRRDFEGRAKYLGIAAFQWLRMLLGVDTVKPDVHLRNFVEPIVGHPVGDMELIRVVEAAAAGLGIAVRTLDAALWEFQRGGPGTI